MEIPSSHAWVVNELKVKLGHTVSKGPMLLPLSSAENAAAIAAFRPPESLCQISLEAHTYQG